MIDFFIEEPGFDDSPERCYKLPFVACEIFTFENVAVKNALFDEAPFAGEGKPLYFEAWDKIYSFFTKRCPSQKDTEKIKKN